MESKSFTTLLIADVTQAHQRLKASDTAAHRRDLIRTAFAAMEGLQWHLKQIVFNHADMVTKLTH